MRAVLLGLAVLVLLSCSSTGSPGPLTEEADEAYRTGDFERAYTLYSKRYAKRPDPLLKEKMDLAWARAHGSRAVTPAEAALQRRESKTMLDRGDRMFADGRYEKALLAYRTAQQYIPGLPEARQGEVKAERGIIDRAVEEAAALEGKGEAGAAIGVLARARALLGEPFDPETDPLTAADRSLRARIESRLLLLATTASDAGQNATALLLARAREEIMGAPAGGAAETWQEEIERAFADEQTRRVHITEVEDETDGLIDPADFTREVYEAFRALPSSRWIQLTPYSEDTGMRLTIRVSDLSVTSSEPVTKREKKEFVIHTEALPNPKLAKLRKSRDRLQEDLRLARSVAYDARREFDSVRRLEGDAEIHARYTRLYGHYSSAGYYRHLANARTRNAKAKRKVDRLEDSLDRVLAEIQATPAIVYEETRRKATVEVTTLSKSARASASFSLQDAPEGGTPDAVIQTTSAEAEVTDSGWPGDAEQGIPEDPIALPTDAEIAADILRDLAGRLAAEIVATARRARRETYDAARRLAKEGEAAEALDLYTAFVLTDRDAFPLESRIAIGRIEAEWGLTVTDDGAVDISNLRLR